jgi:hypothetical protein
LGQQRDQQTDSLTLPVKEKKSKKEKKEKKKKSKSE